MNSNACQRKVVIELHSELTTSTILVDEFYNDLAVFKEICNCDSLFY